MNHCNISFYLLSLKFASLLPLPGFHSIHLFSPLFHYSPSSLLYLKASQRFSILKMYHFPHRKALYWCSTLFLLSKICLARFPSGNNSANRTSSILLTFPLSCSYSFMNNFSLNTPSLAFDLTFFIRTSCPPQSSNSFFYLSQIKSFTLSLFLYICVSSYPRISSSI